MSRSSPPKKKGKGRVDPPAEPPNWDKATPRFCFRHLQSGHDIHALDKDRRADLAVALQRRATMTWEDIRKADKHGLGSERMPADQIRPAIPGAFEGESSFTVLRYSGLLPMVGVRATDTFHVIWIERSFGDVYNHGK